MSKATMTIQGYLAGDGVLAYSRSNDPYLNLSVPHTPRKLNRQTNQWEDAGPTLWVRVTLWRDQAEAFADHALKGTAVVVTGEPVLSTYETRDGRFGANLEIKFPTISIVPRLQNTQNGATSAVSPGPGYSGASEGQNGAQNTADAWAAPDADWAAAYDTETPF